MCVMLAAMIVGATVLPAGAQYKPQRKDIWDLKLGAHVSELPAGASQAADTRAS